MSNQIARKVNRELGGGGIKKKNWTYIFQSC